MKNSIFFKLLACALSLVFCLTALAGCGKDETEDMPQLETFNYETTPVTDEADSIDELNDAITAAVAEYLTENYPLDEPYHYCVSHKIAASTYAENANSFSALVYRDMVYYYDPATGDYDFYYDSDAFCLISFERADTGYSTASFAEYITIDDAIDAADGAFGDADAVSGSFDTAEATPYRYVKDGVIYALDYERYITYCDNLVAELLNAAVVTDSYKPIITNNKALYEKLTESPRIAEYTIRKFLAGEADSPKAYVLYRALEDALKATDESIDYKPADEKKAQTYFEKLLGYAQDMRRKDGTVKTHSTYPTWCLLIDLYDNTLSDADALAELYLFSIPNTIVVHSDNGSLEFTTDDPEYFDIFRENQRWYISAEEAIPYKSNVTISVIKSFYRESGIDSDKYIEFKYTNNTDPNYIFSCNGSMMLVPTEDGKYDAYVTGFADDKLSDILDGLYE